MTRPVWPCICGTMFGALSVCASLPGLAEVAALCLQRQRDPHWHREHVAGSQQPLVADRSGEPIARKILIEHHARAASDSD